MYEKADTGVARGMLLLILKKEGVEAKLPGVGADPSCKIFYVDGHQITYICKKAPRHADQLVWMVNLTDVGHVSMGCNLDQVTPDNKHLFPPFAEVTAEAAAAALDDLRTYADQRALSDIESIVEVVRQHNAEPAPKKQPRAINPEMN